MRVADQLHFIDEFAKAQEVLEAVMDEDPGHVGAWALSLGELLAASFPEPARPAPQAPPGWRSAAELDARERVIEVNLVLGLRHNAEQPLMAKQELERLGRADREAAEAAPW